MKILKYILLILIFPLCQGTCSAQNKPKPTFVVGAKDESVTAFSKRNKVSIALLRELNPDLEDTVFKGDTIYIAPVQSAPKKQENGNSDGTALGKSGMTKEIRFLDKTYLVFEADPHKYKVELFNVLQNGNASSFKSIEAERKKDLLFAMNGGMYERDFTPVGLFISEGKTYTPVNMNQEGNGNFYKLKPNGIFLIDSNNNAQVMTSDVYQKTKPKAFLATQSGPMLLVHGVSNANFQPNSNNVNIRNGVGVNKNNNIVFVLSEDPVNFYEFAVFFKEILNCENALYLDGVVSQAYIPELGQPVKAGPPLGIFITVSKKSPEKGNPEKPKNMKPVNDPGKKKESPNKN